jgi:hypothetical protein
MEPDRGHAHGTGSLDISAVVVADHGQAFEGQPEGDRGGLEHGAMRFLDAQRLGDRSVYEAALEAVRTQHVLTGPDASIGDDRHRYGSCRQRPQELADTRYEHHPLGDAPCVEDLRLLREDHVTEIPAEAVVGPQPGHLFLSGRAGQVSDSATQ